MAVHSFSYYTTNKALKSEKIIKNKLIGQSDRRLSKATVDSVCFKALRTLVVNQSSGYCNGMFRYIINRVSESNL
jgi:hypothetical protein